MAKVTYDKQLTAFLAIDPYNDFISEGGKIWDRLKGVVYPEILEIFQSLPRSIDRRLLLLLAPHELSAFLPYTSDTRRKK